MLSLLFDAFVLQGRSRDLLALALADAPLRPDEYAFTSALHDGRARSTTALARLLGLPVATAHDAVRALVLRGLVERRRDPRDGRAWLLTLTGEGLAAHRETGAAFNRAIALVHEHLTVPTDEIARALHDLTTACAAATDQLRLDDIAASA